MPVVVINPPQDAGPIRVRPLAGSGVPYDAIRAGDENHPLAVSRFDRAHCAYADGSLSQVDGCPSAAVAGGK